MEGAKDDHPVALPRQTRGHLAALLHRITRAHVGAQQRRPDGGEFHSRATTVAGQRHGHHRICCADGGFEDAGDRSRILVLEHAGDKDRPAGRTTLDERLRQYLGTAFVVSHIENPLDGAWHHLIATRQAHRAEAGNHLFGAVSRACPEAFPRMQGEARQRAAADTQSLEGEDEHDLDDDRS